MIHCFLHNRFLALNFAKLIDIRSNALFRQMNCSSRYANKKNKIVKMWNSFRKKSRNNKTNLRELNEIYIKHFQINETKILSKEITKSQNEFSWMKQQNESSRNDVNQREWSWICVNEKILFLRTIIVFYFHLTHRESTKMIVSLRKWQSIVDFFLRVFDI